MGEDLVEEGPLGLGVELLLDTEEGEADEGPENSSTDVAFGAESRFRLVPAGGNVSLSVS